MSASLTNVTTDPEKNKYFRVQANHVAPQGSKYSQENVKKEQEKSRVCAVQHFHLIYLFYFLPTSRVMESIQSIWNMANDTCF